MKRSGIECGAGMSGMMRMLREHLWRVACQDRVVLRCGGDVNDSHVRCGVLGRGRWSDEDMDCELE